MNANGTAAEEMIGFICDEMARDEAACVQASAWVLRERCTQVAYVVDGNLLVIWMPDHWSYTGVTGKRTLVAIEEVARDYTTAVLGIEGPVHVVIGRVNCYRRRGA